jgi:hypothetical protein
MRLRYFSTDGRLKPSATFFVRHPPVAESDAIDSSGVKPDATFFLYIAGGDKLRPYAGFLF